MNEKVILFSNIVNKKSDSVKTKCLEFYEKITFK